jgi:hypothetical protein
MRKKNIGNHTLGSRGYEGKRPIWKKEDKEYEEKGLPNPYHQFKAHVEHDFIRGWYKYDEKAKCFATDSVTKKVEAELVN